jgi:DNA-binding CsgD family transcriptional regulator
MTCALSALIGLATDDYLIGQWNEADELLDEYLRMSKAHSFAVVWPAQYLQALLAAARGDAEKTSELTAEITRWAGSRGMQAVHWHCAHARALAALGQGDYEYGYHQAALVSPPGTFPPYVQHALWVALDLVEAAVHIGRRDAAQAHVDAMHELGIANLSSRMALVVGGSEAIVASGPEATDLFESALALPGAGRWTFDLARIQLAYGIHLRRTQEITEARLQLTSAQDSFVSLGAQPWAVRAANELRATGIASHRRVKIGTQSLTSQEWEIAELAAAGLSNKEIGERLILSHRTVSSHLYRIFPKLGVTSRAALRDALAPQ